MESWVYQSVPGFQGHFSMKVYELWNPEIIQDSKDIFHESLCVMESWDKVYACHLICQLLFSTRYSHSTQSSQLFLLILATVDW